MNLSESLYLLGDCGYSIKMSERIDEMSRASDRVLGKESPENILYILSDWKKAYDRIGKRPTLGQLKKFLDDNEISWDALAALDGNLPRTAPSASSAKRFNIGLCIFNIQQHIGTTADNVRSRVNAGKDEYDKLIDVYWDYYEKNHDGDDVSDIVASDDFKNLVALFRDNPEKAREIFGRNFDKVNSKLQRFINPDSPAALIGEFWDWYYAKKAGREVDFPNDKAEKIADLLETPNAKDTIFGGNGSYFTVLRTISNILGRQLGERDADFDYDSFNGELNL